MAKPPKTRAKRMVERLDLIEEVSKLAGLTKPYYERLKELKNKGLFIEYVLVGGQFVEYLLNRLIVVYETAVNVSLLSVDEFTKSDFNLEITIENNLHRDGIGTALGTLVNTYHCSDKQMLEMANELNRHRTNAAHRLFKTYKGDVGKLNEELRLYTQTRSDHRPIEQLIVEICRLQTQISEDWINRRKLLGLDKK